jgi:hypothetical protein
VPNRKVSEKSLELNVGAELLDMFRNSWGMPKAYLRGLTQREEDQEGVDFYAELNPAARLFAFQFKAPKAGSESTPYRYTLKRDQHQMLRLLARRARNSVFYVFPFYVTPAKLRQDVPQLLGDTWLLALDQMRTVQTFGSDQTRTIRCERGNAVINPEYKLLSLHDSRRLISRGISAEAFGAWYERRLRVHRKFADTHERNPWLIRGLKMVIVEP